PNLEIDQPDARNPGGLVFASGNDASAEPVVRPVLLGSFDALGDKFIGYIDSAPIRLATAGPIIFNDRVTGGVLLATPLPAVLGEMRTAAQSDVALLDIDRRLLGSTLAGVPAGVFDQQSASCLDLASPGRAARRTLDVKGQPYEFQFTHFYLRQQPQGYLAVALSRDAVVAAGLRSAVQMTVLFAAVVLLLLMIGYVLALRLTRPIEDLVAGTQAVARGELSRRLTVRRRDELGELASAFNTMTHDLQYRTRGLKVEHTGQLSRLSGPKMADGFSNEAGATIETVENTAEDRRRAIRLFAELAGARRVLVVPLIRSGRNAGYLLVGVGPAYSLPQQDIEVLQTIATEMALMLENADLRRKTELQAHRLDQA